MKRKRTLWLAVAAAMLVPSKGRARGRMAGAGPIRDDVSQRQSRRRGERRPQSMAPVVSPCGRHVVEVAAGAVFLDGQRVRSPDGGAFVIVPPIWRRDGRALAWIERSRGQARLVVLPAVDDGAELLPWSLPGVSPDDQIFWAGPRRVVVGPAMLVPRAVATWTE
jgi:hypothetical protein